MANCRTRTARTVRARRRYGSTSGNVEGKSMFHPSESNPRRARHRLSAVILLTAVLVWAAHPVAGAQVLYGTLTGNVTDQNDAGVPDTKVVALNVETGVSKETTTNDSGVYVFSDLQPGLYKVTIEGRSFRTHVQ